MNSKIQIFEHSAYHHVWQRKGVDGGWLERHVHLHLDDVEGGERRPVHVALTLVDEDGRPNMANIDQHGLAKSGLQMV